MKKIKVSILALSVLVGGAVFASAADKLIVASTVDVVVTNVAPLVWVDVSAFPNSLFLNSTNMSEESTGFVTTDDKGKIIGFANAIKNWTKVEGSNTVVYAQSSWIGSIKGSVKASKMGQPTIQMTFKGNGYSSPTTNTFVINSQNSSAGNASLNINFKSTSVPVRLFTNDFSPFSAKVVGTSKISFKPGITVIQSSKTISESADLDVDLYSEKNIDARVVAYGTKFGVIADVGNQTLFGTGSGNKNNQFNVNLKGADGGSSLSLKGQLASAAIITPGATNQVVTISTMEEKGKIQGQAVSGNGFFSRFNNFFAN